MMTQRLIGVVGVALELPGADGNPCHGPEVIIREMIVLFNRSVIMQAEAFLCVCEEELYYTRKLEDSQC